MPLDADDAIVPPAKSAIEYDATAVDELPDEAPPKDEVVSPEDETASGEEEPEPEAPAADPPQEFDPRWREPFTGLVFIGHLESEFYFLGHKFKIATPSRRERMQVGPAIRDYQDTATWELAWQSAFVAAFLIEIDGMSLPEPVVRNSKSTPFAERLDWIIDNVHDPVLDEVYTRAFELQQQVDGVVAAMGKASG